MLTADRRSRTRFDNLRSEYGFGFAPSACVSCRDFCHCQTDPLLMRTPRTFYAALCCNWPTLSFTDRYGCQHARMLACCDCSVLDPAPRPDGLPSPIPRPLVYAQDHWLGSRRWWHSAWPCALPDARRGATLPGTSEEVPILKLSCHHFFWRARARSSLSPMRQRPAKGSGVLTAVRLCASCCLAAQAHPGRPVDRGHVRPRQSYQEAVCVIEAARRALQSSSARGQELESVEPDW